MKAQSINHSWTKICGNRMLINYTQPLLLQKVNDQKRMHMIKIWWDHLRNQTLRWPWWTAVFSPIVMATLSMHLQEWDTSADIKLRRRVRSLGKFPDKPHVLPPVSRGLSTGVCDAVIRSWRSPGPKRWESSIRLPNLTPPEFLACTANPLNQKHKKNYKAPLSKVACIRACGCHGLQ